MTLTSDDHDSWHILHVFDVDNLHDNYSHFLSKLEINSQKITQFHFCPLFQKNPIFNEQKDKFTSSCKYLTKVDLKIVNKEETTNDVFSLL